MNVINYFNPLSNKFSSTLDNYSDLTRDEKIVTWALTILCAPFLLIGGLAARRFFIRKFNEIKLDAENKANETIEKTNEIAMRSKVFISTQENENKVLQYAWTGLLINKKLALETGNNEENYETIDPIDAMKTHWNECTLPALRVLAKSPEGKKHNIQSIKTLLYEGTRYFLDNLQLVEDDGSTNVNSKEDYESKVNTELDSLLNKMVDMGVIKHENESYIVDYEFEKGFIAFESAFKGDPTSRIITGGLLDPLQNKLSRALNNAKKRNQGGELLLFSNHEINEGVVSFNKSWKVTHNGMQKTGGMNEEKRWSFPDFLKKSTESPELGYLEEVT